MARKKKAQTDGAEASDSTSKSPPSPATGAKKTAPEPSTSALIICRNK
jgi:hypothetical protein